ncbi:glycosyltransferase [Parasphingopyxis algicola]|uniref:glycosyltransferase family 2 protein n=1 Tax=Parasphingopyxis algicola TaxID=2026624 RepID=UPI0015A0CEAD|nr:glycosyltransferase [Parasphingopyxis algicola]QLC25203.1 glycosyltransferase [Parasphingopyxis algicola]
MSEPLFSVIIPVFNAEETLDRTVRSVLDQTIGDFELLLIDDGSTDASIKKMLRFASEDQRIRVVSQENRGAAAARNLGIEMARGALIAFLDADDIWASTKLECHATVHHRDMMVAVSCAKVAFIGPETRNLDDADAVSGIAFGSLKLPDLVAENPTCTTSNLVVSRECFDTVGGFKEDLHHAEDQEWLMRAAVAGYLIRSIDDLLVGYRASAGGLSADLDSMHRGWRSVVDGYRRSVDVNAAEAVYCRYLARRALRMGAGAKSTWRYVGIAFRRDVSAFFGDRRRGALILLGALASLFLPRTFQRKLFS